MARKCATNNNFFGLSLPSSQALSQSRFLGKPYFADDLNDLALLPKPLGSDIKNCEQLHQGTGMSSSRNNFAFACLFSLLTRGDVQPLVRRL